MIWVFALLGLILVFWVAMKSWDGKSQALDAQSNREAEARAESILADLRRGAHERDEGLPR